MKFTSKAENLWAAAMILGFLLPWVSVGGFFSLAGYQLPQIMNTVRKFADSFGAQQNVPSEAYIVYAVYLIPVLAVLVIVQSMRDADTRFTRLMAGLVPVALLIYALVRGGGTDALKALSVGAYLTLVAAVGMLLTLRSKPATAGATG